MRFQLIVSLLVAPAILCSASAPDQMVFLDRPEDPSVFASSEPTLSDILTIEPTASIFFSYAREIELGGMLNDRGHNITVLVPTNKAIMALTRKPHEGPSDTAVAMTEEVFDRQSKENVLRWVSAHMIPSFPVKFNSQRYDTLLLGTSVEFTVVGSSKPNQPEWKRVEIDKRLHIIDAKEACNGIYYLVDGTIKVD